MKNLKLLAVAFFGITSLISCDKDDDAPVNEEEVITTVTITLTYGSNEIILTSKDLDGDGPKAPMVTVSGGNLKTNTVYYGAVTFLNETVSPADDITVEVKEEGAEHQVFFQVPTALGTFAYTDTDANGKPIGLAFTLTTSGATTRDLTVTLRHLPNKSASGVATGDITNAGGATDADVTYKDIVVAP